MGQLSWAHVQDPEPKQGQPIDAAAAEAIETKEAQESRMVVSSLPARWRSREEREGRWSMGRPGEGASLP